MSYCKYPNKLNGNEEVVEWSEDGSTFVVKNVEEFSKLLPRYFKTANFASFVRQLNMYNFQKQKCGNMQHKFFHPNFKRGRVRDLALIKRKKIISARPAKKIKKRSRDPPRQSSGRMEEKMNKLEKTLGVLTYQNEVLIKSNGELMNHMIRNKLSSDQKIKKLLLMIYNSARLSSVDSQQLTSALGKAEGTIDELKKSLTVILKVVEGENPEGDAEAIYKNERSLNEAIDTLYTITLDPNSIGKEPLANNRVSDEEKLLNAITQSDKMSNSKDAPQLIEESDSESDNNVASSDEDNVTQFFEEVPPYKKDVSSDCEAKNLTSNPSSPSLFKPFAFSLKSDRELS